MTINLKVVWWDLEIDISWAITKSLHQSTQLVRWKAIQNAPVKSWDLRRSITTDIKDNIWSVWTNKKYWKRREYENFKNPHKKFYMKRALESSLVNIQSYFNKNITNALK